MNELLSQVTPLTRGIIWLTEGTQKSNRYETIDYLLDGLLTANQLASDATSSRLYVGKNFNFPLYVFVASELKASELTSFFGLIKDGVLAEHEILVIDEKGLFESLRKNSPDDMKKRFHLVK